MTAYNLFGSRAVAPASGFKWERFESKTGPDWFLLPEGSEGQTAKSYRPLDDPALFLNFADLDYRDRDEVLRFANRYGMLGVDEEGRPRPLPDVTAEHSGSGKSDAATLGAWFPETYRGWAAAIFQMRVAVTVWKCLKVKDVGGLSAYLKYMVDPDAGGVPAEFRGRFAGWSFDTARGRSQNDARFPDRIRFHISPIHMPQLVQHADRLHDRDIFYPAHVALWKLANPMVEKCVSPRFVYVERENRLAMMVIPVRLIGALWLQFMQAVDGNTECKQCRECKVWYSISPEGGGRTKRREFCGNVCKNRDYRRRRDRALELAASLKTPAKIAAQLKEEGLETDVDTVAKWLKTAKQKG